ncbi:hypothetical protein EJ04DRAFT_400605, partial [Polyplosphaeria fusca]
FPLLSLPPELRLKIYTFHLHLPHTLDLDPSNPSTIAPRLLLLRTSHTVHEEAYRVFYSRNTFRVFPVHGRFFHTRAPLLARLPPRYRAVLTRLELRVGPGWTGPPRGWVVDGGLGLGDAGAVWRVRVFVECDPAASEIFEGFRVGKEFYTRFCVGLLGGLGEGLKGLREVEVDAYPSVGRGAPLVRGLVEEAEKRGLRVVWGPERGWDKVVDVGLAGVMQKLSL